MIKHNYKLIIFLGFMLLIFFYLKENNVFAATNGEVYQASTDFRSFQGNHGWYYMERTSNGYAEMKWDSSNNFWKGSCANVIVGSNYQHPDNYDSVRKWVAPVSGNIIITSNGNIKKQDTSGGDGVILKVFKNDIEIWSNYITGTDGTGISFPTQSVEVKVGDSIYFLVNKNNTFYCDTTFWDPRIEYKDYSFHAAGEFNSIQGQNGWYYMEKTIGGYAEMKWDSSNNRWKGSLENVIVANNYQHPDDYDSVRKWVAPVSGNIIITSNGNIKKLDTSGGDGVNAKVFKNDIEIWSNYIAGTDGVGISFPVRSVEVKKGDSLYFILNKNINFYCDTTFWDPVIEYKSYSFHASEDFNSNQGQNGWYYMEKTAGGYAEMKWDSSNNRWKGSLVNVIVGNNYQHPDDYDSVRKWVAPISGSIIITSYGNIRKHDTSGGDGVIVKVFKNDIELWSKYIAGTDGVGTNFPVRSVEVKKGDSIYFIINKNKTFYCDTTIWDPRIEYMSYSFHSSQDFNSIQGLNGWYYMEKTTSGYAEMKWDSVNNHWKGSLENVIIGSNYQHPDNYDSVRKWVAPISGNIIITSSGNIRKHDTSGGDGVIVKVFKNDIELWSNYITGTDGVGINFPATSIEVKEGEAIYFIINKNGNYYCDKTIWEPRIEYIGKGIGDKYTYVYDSANHRINQIIIDGKPIVVFIYDNNGNLISKVYK